ncbi:hypothetical protein PVK06_044804 [Gossypium arboreum]|uniref:ORC6 second cyclin-like domain-containing protein n=1 Tax=Gossypium arboreum TaxID=29729 RepID=A0ABR0MUR1_GOSAR|nr:hypothetical protein PVK06_044804 [Gossypium arboreum]
MSYRFNFCKTFSRASPSSSYKDRFLASLPSSRQASADFTRPVFTAVPFYLCTKKHKLKIDKVRLIEACGTSESEFSCVSTSMKDLCHNVFGISSEKKDPKEVKGNRGRCSFGLTLELAVYNHVTARRVTSKKKI